MPNLALYTFGVLKAPTGSESLVDLRAPISPANRSSVKTLGLGGLLWLPASMTTSRNRARKQ